MKKWILSAVAAGMALSSTAAEPVMTVALGDEYYYNAQASNIDEVRAFYRLLKGKGITLSWGAHAPGWEVGVCENLPMQKYLNDFAAAIRENGIGVALIASPKTLLPYRNRNLQWQAQTLDPATGRRKTAQEWDFASPEAYREFLGRMERFMIALKPREAFFIDEFIFISPGKDAHLKIMSAYWTSPTYSDAALADFRRYVAGKGYRCLLEPVRFPVTTRENKDTKFDTALPAVPITAENSAYLIADDNFPESTLWQAWCDWREDLMSRIQADQFALAEKTYSENPNWQGCVASSPTFWFNRTSGLNADKIAALPQVKYLVAGYMNGRNLMKLKPAADRNGKQLGGMVELSTYGVQAPEPREKVVGSFKDQVGKGATLMLMYPLANFNPAYTDEKMDKKGLSYRPEQIRTWEECVDFLRQSGRLKQLNF